MVDRLSDDDLYLAGLGEEAPPIEGMSPPVAGLGPQPVADVVLEEPSPEEEAARVVRSRSLGPRPRLLDRQAAPIEAPDLGAMGSAAAQAAIEGGGAAVAGAPMAAGAVLDRLGRDIQTGPQRALAMFDAIDAGEAAGDDPRAGPVGLMANRYRGSDAEGRARMRAEAAALGERRAEEGAGEGMRSAGRTLRGAGDAAMQWAGETARENFPVAPEREGDFGVRAARAAGSLPAVLGAAAVGGPVAAGAVIGSQVYATTFDEARQTLAARGVPDDEANARAADAATANAFLQAGLMTVPFVRLLDRMAPAAQRSVLSSLRAMGESGAEFAGANAVGRVAENALARGGYDPDRELTRQVWESLGPDAAVGAVLPGAAGAARGARRVVMEGGRAPSAAPEVVAAARGVEDAARAAQRPDIVAEGQNIQEGAPDIRDRAPDIAVEHTVGARVPPEAGVDATYRPENATEAPVNATPPREAYQAAVERFSRATGLPESVRVRLVDRLTTPEGGMADARYEPAARLVEVAMDTDPAVAVSRVFHEGGGHVALEFANPTERRALLSAADRWLSRPVDEAAIRPGGDLRAPDMAGVRTNLDYIARLNRLDVAEQAGRDLAREEAIAHLAEMHLARSLQERPMVTRALDRISGGIGRLASALRGEGFTTADSVFGAMTSGRRRSEAREGPERPPEGAPALASMRAFHGTPHTFAPERVAVLDDGRRIRVRAGEALDAGLQAALDSGRARMEERPLGAFDHSRINTGEGAQAYGYGLYFADSRDVADTYSRDLPLAAIENARSRFQDWIADHRGTSQSASALRAALKERLDADRDAGGTRAEVWPLRQLQDDPVVMDAVARLSRSREGRFGDENAEAVRAWREIDSAIEKLSPPGRVYEVNIHADPGRMLDWDRQLHEQPPNVQAALADMGVRDQRGSYGWEEARDARGGRTLSFIEEGSGAPLMRGAVRHQPGATAWQVGVGTAPQRMRWVAEAPTLQAAQLMLEERIGARDRNGTPGSRAYLLASAAAGSPAKGSAALRERGVPGLRFLDGLSRDEGRGTRNTVTFSDDIVEILGRYSRREGPRVDPGRRLTQLGMSVAVPADGIRVGVREDGVPYGFYRFEADRDGKPAATVFAEVNTRREDVPDGVLEISDIWPGEGAGPEFKARGAGFYALGRALGPARVRALLDGIVELVRQDVPDLHGVQGRRITGARAINRDRPHEDRIARMPIGPARKAAGGLVGMGYAEGGAVAPAAAPGPVMAPGGGGGAAVPAEAPVPAPAAAPAPPAPNVGAGAVDPETRGALQGVEMWKAAAGLTGRGA